MFRKRSRAVENTINGEPKLFFAEKPVGLGIADALRGDTGVVVLFASKLKIQIPSIINNTNNNNNTSSVEESPPLSPILEFGIKTNRDSNSSLFSSSSSSPCSKSSPELFLRSLSARDIELSEDYTCVISHGPNPKTIHIFDNFVFENFACSSCKKSLGLDKDDTTLICRGEKAFCCHECCNQEMVFDQGSSVDL